MNEELNLIGRKHYLFDHDLKTHNSVLQEMVEKSSFLVLGGAGTIGQSVTKEIIKLGPHKIHVVDISENNLVELVRDIRSSGELGACDFRTYALDIGSVEYDSLIESDGKYDYVLNLSALKHVRSEKDPFTLMRMVKVNILNTEKTLSQAIKNNSKKYFCVSTDKAANPVSMMGASKKIMEMFLNNNSEKINISTARFANVAFSDGSLLHGFDLRFKKIQPIVAPSDIKRYFVTPSEAGQLCLMSCMLGENGDIYFPKVRDEFTLINLKDIALRYIEERNYTPLQCESEEEARTLAKTAPLAGKWPCMFTQSDTTGEKSYEEFYTASEDLLMDRFDSIGIVKTANVADVGKIDMFKKSIEDMRTKKSWRKSDLVDLFRKMLPEFEHKETGKNLDGKM